MSTVSICIPVYNGELFLDEVINNVLDQTYRDLEIIIIDDNSRDSSSSIIEKFESQDDRIKFQLNSSNRGMVNNWNDCLTKASGDFVKLHFQDDLMDLNTIEKMMNAQAKYGQEIVLSDRDYFFDRQRHTISSHIKRMRKLSFFYKKEALLNSSDLASVIQQTSLDYNFMGEPIVGLISKKIIDSDGYYDANFKQRVDFEYWLRLCSNHTFVFLPEPLHHFRIHSNSESFKNLNGTGVSPSNIDKIRIIQKILSNPRYQKLRNHLHHKFLEELAYKIVSQQVIKYGLTRLGTLIDQDFLIKYYRPSFVRELIRKFKLGIKRHG
jgi:glycosyltransferase involved in cell wall biosynthesis